MKIRNQEEAAPPPGKTPLPTPPRATEPALIAQVKQLQAAGGALERIRQGAGRTIEVVESVIGHHDKHTNHHSDQPDFPEPVPT